MIRYLIGITDDNHGCGNDFTCVTELKHRFHIDKLAHVWNNSKFTNHDEIYLITEFQYTQKVCEMNNECFVKHIRKIGIKII